MISKYIFRGLMLCSCAVMGMACGKLAQNQGVIVEVDVNNSDNPDKMFAGFECVALETTDENLVGEITKIEVTDDRIYLLDKRVAKACFVFNRAGRSVGKIDRRGRGPGEYIAIQDMQVFDGEIYLYDREGGAILVYAQDGEFLRDYKVNEPFNHFAVVDGNTIWLSSEQSNDTGYNFVQLDCVTGEFTAKIDSFERADGLAMQESPFNAVGGGEFLVTKRFEHTVYSLTRESIAPLYNFRFNTRDQIPRDFAEVSAVEMYDMLSRQWVVDRLKAVTKRGDNLIMTFSETAAGQRFSHLVRWGETNGEMLHLKLDEQDVRRYPGLSNPLYLGRNFMVSCFPAFVVMDWEKNFSLGLFRDGELNPGDNPVLFFWNFKSLP